MGILLDPEMYAPAASTGAETAPVEKPASVATPPSAPTEGGLSAWAASVALKGIEKVKGGLGAVDALFKKAGGRSAAETERLRAINLAAVEVWEVYNKEGERVENDNATGVLGHVVGFVDYLIRDDGKTIADDRGEKWALERKLVAEIKKTIASGEADTLREALNLIRSYGPASLREPAKRFLGEKGEFGHRKGYPLWELVDFASWPDKDTAVTRDLLERAFELEYDADAVETPFAVYSLVHAVSTDPKVKKEAEEGMKALSGESGFGRAALKFAFSSSPEGAALDVGLMFASAGLGNLAKLGAFAKLEKAGMTGYKAVALAKAAEIGAVTTALWALNAGREALTHDVGKALDPAHLAKSLASTGLMIGFLKVFGAAGEGISKRLGVSKSLVGHGAGLAGMIAATKAGAAMKLHDAPVGGAKESLAHDIFGYVKFALAHKAADRLLGGKLSEISRRFHAETAAVAAKVKIHAAIDDLLATSPRVPDNARETIRNDILAEALRTGRIPDRVADVLPRILEALRAEGSKKTKAVEKAESGVTVALRDEDILTSDTEVLPAAARRAISLPERPISLGPYRKGPSPSAGTFHAARIRLKAIHAKIEKGTLSASDPSVLKEMEKCEMMLEKYGIRPTKGIEAHSLITGWKNRLLDGYEAMLADYGHEKGLALRVSDEKALTDGRAHMKYELVKEGDGSEPVLTLERVIDEKNRSVDLYNIEVSEAHRGAGIGKAIFRDLEPVLMKKHNVAFVRAHFLNPVAKRLFTDGYGVSHIEARLDHLVAWPNGRIDELIPSFDLLGIEYLRFGSDRVDATLKTSETVVARPQGL
ncbi:MAG TPA: hypothetical protein VLJ37_07795 [bacterium]|nr:hypothetical protein [bacterium]